MFGFLGESRHTSPSNNDEWRVHRRVGAAECRNHAVASTLDRTEVDEKDLVFVIMDKLFEFPPHSRQVHFRQMALENGELQMVTPRTHLLEYAAQA